MTEFGKWLGQYNGKTMLSDCLQANITAQQAVCVVTTYCIIFGIEVDTSDWDGLMAYIWEYYNSWFQTYEKMEDAFAKYLV